MSSYCKVMILGRLGDDPELFYTGEGKPLSSFSVATNERTKTENGEYSEKTEWHQVVIFNKNAENCANYLQKGSMVHIEGKLRTTSREDKYGRVFKKTQIVAERVLFMDKKRPSAAPKASLQDPEISGNTTTPLGKTA